MWVSLHWNRSTTGSWCISWLQSPTETGYITRGHIQTSTATVAYFDEVTRFGLLSEFQSLTFICYTLQEELKCLKCSYCNMTCSKSKSVPVITEERREGTQSPLGMIVLSVTTTVSSDRGRCRRQHTNHLSLPKSLFRINRFSSSNTSNTFNDSSLALLDCLPSHLLQAYL